jgi:hypothetical protein
VDIEARVAQSRLEHRPEVVLVVDEEEAFTAHATRLTGASVSTL